MGVQISLRLGDDGLTGPLVDELARVLRLSKPLPHQTRRFLNA